MVVTLRLLLRAHSCSVQGGSRAARIARGEMSKRSASSREGNYGRSISPLRQIVAAPARCASFDLCIARTSRFRDHLIGRNHE